MLVINQASLQDYFHLNNSEQNMDNKLKGVLLGVASFILWFMPLASWEQEFMGQMQSLYQAGYHIGGVGYLLLIASSAYAILSWFEQHQLRIIASVVALGICILLLIQAGSSVAWGLILLTIVSTGSAWLAISDNNKLKTLTSTVQK